MWELKRLTGEAVPKAVERAEHYRLLNDPEQAESICLDVLDVEPDNQRALRVLVLAMTDQFAGSHGRSRLAEALAYASKLTDDYERVYYSGIIYERKARAFLASMARSMAYDPFVEAMRLYEQAEPLRPRGNDDPILRWNSCARTIRRERLSARRDEGEPPLE